jgi:bifunctional ADP-heptose synthase (sugar kinase/adenylyltransferase)
VKNLAQPERLKQIVQAFPRVTVAVLGDMVADEFVFGEISRVSREAPVRLYRAAEPTRFTTLPSWACA